eukprot:TRINITY_DN12515_c0_g1_i1.p1 TRINITY_DN12515_c0_g1~~TRINITY_DN12515_c0_g1_i1.p1  ORF type:complete len:558 (+),score=142.44 TRINITY_DN12515_c0_g1_i1:445-2118(+)
MSDTETYLFQVRDAVKELITLLSINPTQLGSYDVDKIYNSVIQSVAKLSTVSKGVKEEQELDQAAQLLVQKVSKVIQCKKNKSPSTAEESECNKASQFFRTKFAAYVQFVRTQKPSGSAPANTTTNTPANTSQASNSVAPKPPQNTNDKTDTQVVVSPPEVSEEDEKAAQRKKMLEEKKRQLLEKKRLEQEKKDEEKRKYEEWQKEMEDSVRSRVRAPIDENQRLEMMLKNMKEWELSLSDVKFSTPRVKIEAKRRNIKPTKPTLTVSGSSSTTGGRRKRSRGKPDSPREEKKHSSDQKDEDRYMIGKGGFGAIYLVEYAHTLAAMKILDAPEDCSKEAESEFEAELEVLMRLRHPNVLLYLGGSTKNDFFFITELMDTDLNSVILKKDSNALWDNKGKVFARDIFSAITYLHSKRLVHKDIKSANILLKNDTAKLADFGLVKTVEEKSNRLTLDRALSYGWASPEQINPNAPVSFPTDVYSMAIVVWEMLTLEQPWDGFTTYNLIMGTTQGQFKQYHQLPKQTPPQLSIMLSKCWLVEPNKRPTAEECLLAIEELI